MKKAGSLFLALLLVLALLPVQEASAAETEEKVCYSCGQALSVRHSDINYHCYFCSNPGCENYYNTPTPEKEIREEHSLDENCYCSVCHTYNHSTIYFSGGVHKAATCTEDGFDTDETCWYCTHCSQYFPLVYVDGPSEPITGTVTPALGHDLIHHDAKAATCTEAGWEAYDTCSRCDYTTYEEIPALGHALVHHDAKAAACTEIGWEAYDICSNCDYTTYKEISALGHDWGEWQVTAEPEAGRAGERQRTCSRCSKTETEPIAALVAYFVTGGDASWTKGSSGGITLTVKRSEDDAGCFGHYAETLIDGSPVAVFAKAGSTIVTISADTLEKLSIGTHTVTVKFDDGRAATKLTIKAAGLEDPVPPETGYNGHIGLYIALLCLSGLGLCVLSFYDLKRHRAK